jgi:hypothetical protein
VRNANREIGVARVHLQRFVPRVVNIFRGLRRLVDRVRSWSWISCDKSARRQNKIAGGILEEGL